jgi:hypothetical protein
MKQIKQEEFSMKATIKTIAKRSLLNFGIGKKVVLSYSLSPYFERMGWFRSVREHLPVDQDGNPLPWFTYPSMLFLKGKIRPEMTVFEYGSGNSTLWWSNQVSSVTSCEHDREWLNSFKAEFPPNIDSIHCELDYGGEYCKTILAYKSSFDIIVIDGRDRVNCAINSIGALKEDGVILWDNSDRGKYKEGCSYLLRNGFRRLDFWGLGPIGSQEWCTSIFYRDNNGMVHTPTEIG